MFGLGKKTSAAASADEGPLFDEAFQRKLEYLALVSRRAVSGRTKAERRSKRTGSGVEFADHRDYVPGDDFRFLDWNVYGRTGKLLLRLFEEEEDLSVYILVDRSRSMGFGRPTKLRYGKQIAAALAFVALAHLDRVSLQTFDAKLDARLPPTRGKNRIFRVFQFLETVQAEGHTKVDDSLKAFCARNKRRGVAILISDLYDAEGLERGLDQLRYAKFEPHVLHLVDPSEDDLPLNGDVRLVDRETGRARDVTITAQVLEKYRAARARHQSSIEAYCKKKQVGYARLDMSVPFDDAVLKLLREGGLVA